MQNHSRKSPRHPDHDYKTPGEYFITVNTQDRFNFFGEIKDGIMFKNDAGDMVERWWHEIERKYPSVKIDTFVVMPNHFHGIVIIGDSIARGRLCAPPDLSKSDQTLSFSSQDKKAMMGESWCGTQADHSRVVEDPTAGGRLCAPPDIEEVATSKSNAVSLIDVMWWFKTMTTNEYIRGVKKSGWTSFRKKVWQVSYHDEIIQVTGNLEAIRQYIRDNPKNWKSESPDAFNCFYPKDRDGIINFPFRPDS